MLKAILLATFAALGLPALSRAQCTDDLIDLGVVSFGISFDIEADTMVVGAPYFDVGGVVYVFERDPFGWQLVQELRPLDPTPGKSFGFDVAISGQWIAVGATGNAQNRGAAYIFRRIQGAWEQRKKLVRPVNSPGDAFGRLVDIEGDLLAVSNIHSELSGDLSAYRHHPSSGWSPPIELEPAMPQLPFSMRTLAVSQGRILASGDDYVGSGLIASYRWDGTTYVLDQRVAMPAGSPGSGFGHGMAVDGDTLVGASFLGGQVHVYLETPSGWEWNTQLPVPNYQDLRLALYEDLLLVGTPVEDTSFFFERQQGTWRFLREYNVPGAAGPGITFAWSLALDGETSVVRRYDEIFVSDGAQRSVPYCACDRSAPCGNTNVVGGCTNSTGLGGYLEACGSPSVTSDRLVLRATRLPGGQTGLFYMGGSALHLPFGAGLRCVGNGGKGVFRFAPASTGVGGQLTLGPGIAAQSAARFGPSGAIQAGSTWYLQAWYRDPLSPCGTFNLTNAIRTTFLP